MTITVATLTSGSWNVNNPLCNQVPYNTLVPLTLFLSSNIHKN